MTRCPRCGHAWIARKGKIWDASETHDSWWQCSKCKHKWDFTFKPVAELVIEYANTEDRKQTKANED